MMRIDLSLVERVGMVGERDGLLAKRARVPERCWLVQVKVQRRATRHRVSEIRDPIIAQAP